MQLTVAEADFESILSPDRMMSLASRAQVTSVESGPLHPLHYTDLDRGKCRWYTNLYIIINTE